MDFRKPHQITVNLLASAQNNLGFLYHNGTGVTQSFTKAKELFHATTEAGDPSAQYMEEAVNWFLKAALQGHIEAKYTLGNIYDKGLGVKIDYTEVAKWIQQVAHAGFAKVQFQLGMLYKKGLGVAQDYTAATQ